MATSCGIGVTYQGVGYNADCRKVHPSRVGEALNASAEPNEFFGDAPARRLLDIDPNQVFLLEADRDSVKFFCPNGSHSVIAYHCERACSQDLFTVLEGLRKLAD